VIVVRAAPRLTSEVAVIGASLGGVLAAWQAARAGAQVLLAAEFPWLGGQLTAQAVPPDEHALVEQGGATASYLAWRERMRAAARAQPGFRDCARMTAGTNPGDGWVSRLCIEPAQAARDLELMLLPAQREGRLRLLRGVRPAAVQRRGSLIAEVVLQDAQGAHHVVHADVFVDATDTGELLHLAGLPYRLGSEATAEFGEPDAPLVADRLDQQPVTHVLALRRMPRPGPVAAAPPSYAYWRQHRVAPFGHALFSAHLPGRGGRSATLPFTADEADARTLDWWRYRRIVSAAMWDPAVAPRHDVSLVNWAQNDYALLPLLDGPMPTARVQAAARELSLAFLHWLHTEAPREDGAGRGYPEWQPATDMLGTRDGLAQQTYVRESRRIVAQATLTQCDLLAPPQPAADAVGIGAYALDIHPTVVHGRTANASVHPFVLPLGAFVPQHADNLLPACKNIGMTQLAGASARVHPVEWCIGEVAGLMAAQMAQAGCTAPALADSAGQRAALFAALAAAGVPRHWPAGLVQPAHHP
jgi:hypothetical protein